MKTFKRYSAALEAAGDQDIIEVRIAGQSVYIVPGENYLESVEEIRILTAEPCKYAPSGQSRRITGQVTPRHLKRLGNANWAKGRDEMKAEAAALATA